MPRSEADRIVTRIIILASNGLYPLASGLCIMGVWEGGFRATQQSNEIESKILYNKAVEQFVEICFFTAKKITIFMLS